MKRILLLFIVFLSFGILVACSSDDEGGENDQAADVEVNKEGYPIVDEKITLSMIAPGSGLAEWEDMPFLQEYSDRTNVYFNYNTPPVNDFQTNLNLAFASGDIEDVIFGAGSDNLTPAMEVDYGAQGILLPLEDLIDEYAPNFKKLLEERPDIEKSITAVDGHIYSLPMVSVEYSSSWKTGPLWYNGEWLDALNVEELPKTTDEFYDLLVRFRDEDPNGNGKADEIPLLDIQMDSSRPWLLAAFGIKEWGIEENDGKVRYAPIQPEYKEYLQYMNKLYEEKLLDPETFSQSSEQKKAKGQNNRIGVFPDWFSFFTTGDSQEEAMNDPMFHPITNDPGSEPVVPIKSGVTRGAFSLSSDNPNPEAAMRWVDYFYSQEGWEELNKGPEGYTWEWDEEKETKLPLDPPEGFESSEEYRATITPDYAITTPTLRAPKQYEEISDFDQFLTEETNNKIKPFGEVPYPLVYFTNDEQKEINTIEVDLKSYVEQMEAKFITGVKPMSDWDEYVETIEKMNVERYVELYQKAYDRWADSAE
ncbi:extracellular solute-binding protein [Paraliobacillus salinarum]|uniref:extracellular solute-binding protein n=1 Tax=Paraliobacillus salinarum TaxID=1158996 RepID=UPI0015F64681|nr:extracellular solute-binding protein [Paraliobacillus salinarum]